ncbi:MAG: class I tRNA ligase family protein, partial [Arenimonas sp.]|nr:class I tRNA ligase family protein [Arenimonas sp.]
MHGATLRRTAIWDNDGPARTPRPMTPPRPALVTTALPYANGPLHLGHLVGYLQADT